MQFTPKLRDFLGRNGAIYTVRRFAYRASEVYVRGVGRCKRTFIHRVSGKEELSVYVEQSGFSTVEEWWKAIKTFIPDISSDMWLFKVVVKR